MSSTRSSATITTLAIFEHGRRLEGMSYVFDAQIYVENGPPILAALRYFNSSGREFTDLGFHFVTAQIAKIEPGANIAIQPNGPIKEDYDLVGDIVNLISIRVPDGIEVFNIIDPKHLPYMEICGIAESVDDLAGTFRINAHQYISRLKFDSTGNTGTTASTSESSLKSRSFKSTLPIHFVIPASGRWKTKSGKRITPKNGGYVLVTGSIKERLTEGGHKWFSMEVDSMVFLDRPIIVLDNSKTAGSSTQAPGHTNMKFDFSAPRPAKKCHTDGDA